MRRELHNPTYQTVFVISDGKLSKLCEMDEHTPIALKAASE